MPIRPAAVAGTWYPGSAGALSREVDQYVDAAADGPYGLVRAIIAPHAGIMFSGPVGAYAYRTVALNEDRADYDVAVLVGPSHFVAFEGVSIYPEGAFETPLGLASIDAPTAVAIARADIVRPLTNAHVREHSLEMQLPFLKRLLPDLPIVPLLMGHQTRATIERLAAALAAALAGRRALIVASTDLSHYFDSRKAETLDREVRECVQAFDDERLLSVFERYPDEERGRHVGCGIGPALAVMKAARALGASDARVLKYGHSGEISGDNSGVVGYMAAAIGTFDAD
ncbi:MAG TPA: AmmeMemoRadiSam system protein B [Vicinamibacterales bacterium]|jgi:AmmeMemoRadiSam system protein B